jgi:cysteine rich repeat protein
MRANATLAAAAGASIGANRAHLRIDDRNLNVALFLGIRTYRLNKEAIMVRGISFVITLLLISNVASAQNRSRPNAAPNDDACKIDSHRYCQHVFPAQRDLPPDQFEMLSCLQEHREKLSKACNEMLKGHGI